MMNTDTDGNPVIGQLYLTLNDNGTRVATSTDSFQPAFFETSANEQRILHLPAGTTLETGHSYTVGLQEQGGTVPAFMVWAVPVQVTAGTEATATATVTPKTINRLTDKDADGNLIRQLTITDPTVHFTKNGTRSIRIVKVASDGTETEVYPKTLIQNGTDGTIITENYTEGNTIVQVSHNFTDKATYPKGTYKVELYLTDTATKPVAEGTFVIVERPLKLVFFHDDHLGTPRLITDEDGQTVSIHDYLAYGEEITTAEFQTNRMKFTGHERDPETGLDYMKARYYSAGVGRFLQVDPGYDYDQTDPMSFNLYGYVRGNPVMGTDPDGKFTLIEGLVVLAIGGTMAIIAYKLIKGADDGEKKDTSGKQKQALKDIANDKQDGPNGPPNKVIQQTNTDVLNSAKQLMPAAEDALKLSLTPPGPAVGEGAKPANAGSLFKTAWDWIKKGADWLLDNSKADTTKKEGLKFNASKNWLKPDPNSLDKIPEPKKQDDKKRRLPERKPWQVEKNKLS